LDNCDSISNRLTVFISDSYGQKQRFAEAIGVSASTISHYLAGSKEPSAEVLRKIAAAGCNVHWLLTGEGEMWAANATGMGFKTIAEPESSHDEPAFLKEKLALQTDELERLRCELKKSRLRGPDTASVVATLEDRIRELDSENEHLKSQLAFAERIILALKT
jgi:transcriptional regulator with XRE-family HTH domain